LEPFICNLTNCNCNNSNILFDNFNSNIYLNDNFINNFYLNEKNNKNDDNVNNIFQKRNEFSEREHNKTFVNGLCRLYDKGTKNKIKKELCHYDPIKTNCENDRLCNVSGCCMSNVKSSTNTGVLCNNKKK